MKMLLRLTLLAAAITLLVAAAALAAVVGPSPSTYAGRTSQGQSITIKFTRSGGHEIFTVNGSVRGTCQMDEFGPVPGSGSFSTRGYWSIRKGYYTFEQKTSTEDVRLAGSYPGGTPSQLKGTMRVGWQPDIYNVHNCASGSVSWTVTKR